MFARDLVEKRGGKRGELRHARLDTLLDRIAEGANVVERIGGRKRPKQTCNSGLFRQTVINSSSGTVESVPQRRDMIA